MYDDHRPLFFMCCAALFGVIVFFIINVWIRFPLSEDKMANLAKTESQCVLTALKAHTSSYLVVGHLKKAQSDCRDAKEIDKRNKLLTPH